MKYPPVRVGELAQQIRGVTYAKADATDAPSPGYLPVLRAGNITDRGLDFRDLVFVPQARLQKKQRIQQNDVVVATSSGSLGVVGKAARALQDFDGGFGAFCKVLRPNERVHPGYFAHFFKTAAYRRQVSSLAAGVSINNLRSEHLDELLIPLPTLGEQRRIAAILDQAAALRTKRRATIDHINDLGQAIFHDMFGPAGRYPKQKFGDLVREFRYGTSNKSREGGGYPALRIPNVIGGHLDLADLKTVPVTEAEYSRLALHEGDLLFVRTNGNPHNVGRCAVVEDYLLGRTNYASDQFIYASYLIRARLDTDAVDPTFARVYLSSPAGRRQLRERSKTSAGQFNINIAGLESILLPAVPIEAQRAFAHRVQSVRTEEEVHRRSATVLDELFAVLQARAFSGQL